MADGEARQHVTIWSDGSSLGNPGPGGYGTVLVYVDAAGQEHRRELSQGYERTTNNRMELMGAIAGLEALKRPCVVMMRTDSDYVANGFNRGWLASWQKNGWKNAKKKPVENRDLWERLLAAVEPHEVSWEHVQAHVGVELNERCDSLAKAAADGRDGERVADEGYRG